MTLTITPIEKPINEEVSNCDAGDCFESFYICISTLNGHYWIAKIDGVKPDGIANFGDKAILVIVERALNILDNKSRSLRHYYPKENSITDMINHPTSDEKIIYIKERLHLNILLLQEDFTLKDSEIKFSWVTEDEAGFIEDVYFDKIIKCDSKTIYCSIKFQKHHELTCEFDQDTLEWKNKNDIQQQINTIKSRVY